MVLGAFLCIYVANYRISFLLYMYISIYYSLPWLALVMASLAIWTLCSAHTVWLRFKVNFKTMLSTNLRGGAFEVPVLLRVWWRTLALARGIGIWRQHEVAAWAIQIARETAILDIYYLQINIAGMVKMRPEVQRNNSHRLSPSARGRSSFSPPLYARSMIKEYIAVNTASHSRRKSLTE